MNHIMSSRQNNFFRSRTGSIQSENSSFYKINQVKSLHQSPKSGSLYWLRRTDCHLWNHSKDKYLIQHKSQEKIFKSRPFNYHQNNKNQKHINIPHHNVKFKTLQNLNLQQALYLLNTSINQCLNMHNCYGSSYFNIKNYHLNSDNKLVISTNSHALKFNASPEESVVVRDIIQSIHKICSPKCFDDFYSYYKRSSLKKKCDFRFTLMLIRSYCQCSKINLPIRIQKPQHIQFEFNNKCRQYSKSQQKSLPFLINLTNLNTRKNSFSKVSRRQSVYRKLFQPTNQINLSNQKLMHKQILFKNQSKYKKFPLKNKQIKNQYNIIYNPKFQQTKIPQKKNCQIKQSTVSTNFKSSHHPGDYLQISMTNLLSRISMKPLKSQKIILTKSNQCKQHFSFLPTDLDEVQSLGQSSDYDQQSQLPTRRFETPRDSHQQNTRRENQQRILSINNWTKRVNSLLAEQTDLKQSIIDDTAQYKQNNKNCSNPEGLSRMIRTIAQSVLPLPSQFHVRNP